MRHFYLGAMLLFTATLAGCCCPAINAAREAAQNAQSMNNMMQLCIAAITYYDMQSGWPESLEDLRNQVPDLDLMLANPLTMDDPGYEYVQPAEGTPPGPDTVIIYQLRNGSRDMTLPVGYADGSVH